MNIKRAKQEIKDTIQAYLLRDQYGEFEIPVIRQRPVLLLGAPGIGKTQIMEQIARECEIGLVSYTITHHTRQSAIGLPFISKREYGGCEKSVTEYTMSEIIASVYEKIEKTGLQEGILFIDEINCVSETLAPAMLQFLQCKTFGNHAVPQGWVIVAAGNPPEYNKSVREFDVVTMDRVKRITVEPDQTVWKEYARLSGIHPAVVAYLDARPRYFYYMEASVDGELFATPRGWEDLSRMIQVYEKLNKNVDREVIEQYIQYPAAASDFANYLELYYKYQTDYQIEEILKGNIDTILLKKISHAAFDERLSVVALLLSHCAKAARRVYRKERKLQSLLRDLKAVGAQMEEGCLGLNCLEEIQKKEQEEFSRKKQVELLDLEGKKEFADTIETLGEYIQRWKLHRDQCEERGFEQIREWFLEDRKEYEAIAEGTGGMFENCFDFMEAAFGVGQEMVIFITDLNTDYYCAHFLEEYYCERYYQYNEQLLFERGNERLLYEIEQEERDG